MNNRNRQRGFSIAEVLTVSVICAILLTAMVMIVPLVMRAPRQIQAQVDDVNTAAIALYKIRRDFAESDSSGVMGCTTAPVVTCSTYSSPTTVQALTVASADNGGGQFVDPGTGYPLWQGIIVYWLVPNADGTAFDLMRAFIPEPVSLGPPLVATIKSGPGGTPIISAVMAQAAVTTALLINPPPVMANYIKQIQVGTNNATDMVTFTLTAGTSSGSSLSSTTFQSNTYARN